MKTKPIDERHLAMLKLILMDDRILQSLHVDGNLAKQITVNKDGSISIGRYSNGWVNSIFNSYFNISFFEVVQRIAFVITGGNSNNCDNDGLVGFIHEAIDKVLKKDEKEKVIELLLHYCTLLSNDSPLKLTYNSKQDDPRLNQKKETRAYRHMAGVADAYLDLGTEQIPIQLHVDIQQPLTMVGFINQKKLKVNIKT